MKTPLVSHFLDRITLPSPCGLNTNQGGATKLQGRTLWLTENKWGLPRNHLFVGHFEHILHSWFRIVLHFFAVLTFACSKTDVGWQIRNTTAMHLLLTRSTLFADPTTRFTEVIKVAVQALQAVRGSRTSACAAIFCVRSLTSEAGEFDRDWEVHRLIRFQRPSPFLTLPVERRVRTLRLSTTCGHVFSFPWIMRHDSWALWNDWTVMHWFIVVQNWNLNCPGFLHNFGCTHTSRKDWTTKLNK